jgi:hypothetical protein
VDWIDYLDRLKGVTLVQVVIIVAITIGVMRSAGRGLRELRARVREDNRADLGLGKDETLASKVDVSVQAGFTSAVEPIATELSGVRAALTNHGVRLRDLEVQVAALTGQVGGLPAVHAFRARIEHKLAEKAEKAARKDGER